MMHQRRGPTHVKLYATFSTRLLLGKGLHSTVLVRVVGAQLYALVGNTAVHLYLVGYVASFYSASGVLQYTYSSPSKS